MNTLKPKNPISTLSRRWLLYLLLAIIGLICPKILMAQEAGEVDHVALAQILIKDGYYQRAQRTLNKIKEDGEESQKALVESLWGMIELHHKHYDKAIDRFLKSQRMGLKSTEIYLYLAEAYLQINHLEKAEINLKLLHAEFKQKLPYHLLKAEILWRQKQKLKAWIVLDQAQALGLSRLIIDKKRFSYLLDEQLYLAATDLAHKTLSQQGSFQEVLAMASQLRQHQQYQSALGLLQILSFLRPDKEMVALEMAQNYLALSQSFSAALILETAAKHNISLSFEASEILRQVGKSYRARFLNMTTEDPAKRLKQKLALYLEEDDYLSLKYMIPQLQKTQLLEDQEIRYAVAYSLFRIGDFEKSNEYLNAIDKDGLFEKSIELKREIQNCQNEDWACSETI